MALSQPSAPWVQWLAALAGVLDPRSAPRLVRLFLGALLAAGRRTVTAWLRAAGVAAGFRAYYRLLPGLARRARPDKR